ncbi:hypothetical protein D3C87_2036450 [compost metagenome]
MIEKSLVPAFLTTALVEPVLIAARRVGASVFDQNIRPAQWRRQWRMLRFGIVRRL